MADQLRTIRLYGVLGARFGREYRLAVANAAEAVHALSMQLPGFKRFLMEAKDRGMGFAVFHGRENLREDQLGDPPGNAPIRIAPVLLGSKNGGVFNIILGAVLVVAGAFLAPYTAGFSAALMNMGYAMIIGGVTQLLAPQPKGLGAKDSPANTPSYSFNGAVNTQAQGNPVPLAYGRCWAGTAVVSAGIYAEDQQ